VCCGVRCSVFGQCMTHIWCVRCLLITKSPHAPCHFRYLIWVDCYIPYVGLNGVQSGDYLCSILRLFMLLCILRLWIFWSPCFQHFWNRSCMQLSISVLLFRGASWPVVMNIHIYTHTHAGVNKCRVISHVYDMPRIYERVMSCMDYMSHTYDTPHIRISHVIHSKGWCNQWACVCMRMSHVNICNMSHISMRHIKYIWRVMHMN